MSLDLASDFPAARRALDEVDEALGRRLSRDMHARDDGAAARLARTEDAQPALLAHAAAALAALRAELGDDGGGSAAALASASASASASAASSATPLRLGPHAVACVLGHSVGEYAALVAAGAMPLGGAARALRLRARRMQEAADADAARGTGGERAMLALLLAVPPPPTTPTTTPTTPTTPTEEPPASPLAPMLAAVRELEVACRAAEAAVGGVAAVAGANSPQQVVLSGHAATIERAAALYRAAAAAASAASVSARAPGLPAVRRAVRLPVGAPFHCAVMAPAAEALRRSGFVRDGEGDGASDAGADADGAAVRALAAPRAPLVSGVDAAPHAQPSELRGLLADGLTRTVRFAEGVVAARGLQGGAAARFLELGPGGALAALVRQTLGESGSGGGGGGGGGTVFSVGTTAALRAYVGALEAEERAGATRRA